MGRPPEPGRQTERRGGREDSDDESERGQQGERMGD